MSATSYEVKRIAKKVAKNGVWAASDIVFLVLKAVGAVLLTVITTGVIFMSIFLIYVKTNLYTELDVDPADFSMNLSSDIYYIDPETGVRKELVTLQSTEFRVWVDIADIPEHTIQALVAIEDHRFFKHSGVDWYRTSGAFLNMFLSMRDTFGGSTITQQLIKNLTNQDETTVQRKMLEIFRALEYEKQYSKDDILELYFNLVYFGHGRYGIAAAADYYFGKDITQLSLAESAAIVGITNNPSKYSPYTQRAANKERQETILGRMYELEYISEDEFKRSQRETLRFQRGEHSEYEEVIYTWFEETVIRDAIADLVRELDIPESLARRRLFTGGLKIISTFNPDMQAIVDSVYENPESLPKVSGSSQQLQSGIIIADPYTGEIRALSGGVGEKTRNMLLNRATMTRRPPGSSIKPLAVYAPAMEYGYIRPDSVFNDSPEVTLRGTTWMTKNAGRGYSGPVDIRTAIILSINTVSAMVLDRLSPAISYRFMKDTLGFGLSPADENYAPLSVGQLTYGATVREMTSGFTMFPNAGQRVALRSYTTIYNPDGTLLLDNSPKYTKAISESTAYWMTSILHSAVTGGTGGAANLGAAMPTAGKTGTTTDSKDRWFVGFTPYYIAAVWTGFDTPAVMSSSANPAAQIWKMIMSQVHEGLETRTFGVPDDTSLPSVQGGPMADYSITCYDLYGGVIQEEYGFDLIGREVIVSAPVIEGYTLLDDYVKSIIISGDPMWDYIDFMYMSDEFGYHDYTNDHLEYGPPDDLVDYPTDGPFDDPAGVPPDGVTDAPTDDPPGSQPDGQPDAIDPPVSESPPAQLPPVDSSLPDPAPQQPPQESPTHQLPPVDN